MTAPFKAFPWFPPVYKFMNRKFLDGFLKRGCVKIGTGAEYRIPDGFDGGRADPNEMVRRWRPGAIEIENDHPFVQQFVTEEHKGKNIRFAFEEDVTILNGLDAYVFSASREYNEDLAQQMVTMFDADCCVEITDPVKFLNCISQHEPFKGRPAGLDHVTYGETNEFSSFAATDPFRKLSKFEWQKEFRFVWAGPAPESIVIEIPEVVPLLRKL